MSSLVSVTRLSLSRLVAAALFLVLLLPSRAQAVPKSPVPIDFSYAGYEGGGHAIPSVPAVLLVRPSGGDDTALIQGALDRAASRPLNSSGFRGAVLLAPGHFKVSGQLTLRTSGLVLRGSGTDRTTIQATGIRRRTLIEIGAEQDPTLGTDIAVTSDAPAGALMLHLASVDGLHVGDPIVVRRPSTAEWISAIGMSGLPGTFANQRLDWHPGSHDLVWDRTVTAIDAAASTIQLDAPITTALEQKYGGGIVARVAGDPAPSHIGIEDLTLDSSYDTSRPKDEDHSWIAILLDHVEDAWVRNVTARHFVTSAVRVNLRGRRITVENCRSEAPISEEGGYRRQSFLLYGQQVLVYRCSSEQGMNDFATGMLAGGPNVFLDCDASHSLEASGPFEGWSSGVLYENVHIADKPLQMLYDFSRAQGAGWTAANSLIWNSTALSVDAIGPPDARNFIVNSPQPLYASELLARTGAHLPAASVAPAADASASTPEFRSSDLKPSAEPAPDYHPVQIVNGRFVRDGEIVWGNSQNEAWWRGDTSIYTAAASTGSSVTRFMPGVTAPGETEDLKDMAARLKARGIVSIQINPGLWYEHRRDAHNVERRSDGDVWAPFYEMPWARSGKGTAWDGLSKFDVSKYNPWYFEREREFAKDASEDGIIVFYDLYNDHNVLEIGPHWIDFPWRPANNINDTGLPEPPPFKPHGRNDVGNEFFSTAYAPLRKLHHDYMMHTFDEMADFPNVIFGIAYQYAGPLAFEQFFQDTAREWEQKHPGKHIRIALTTGKQTTDAILADPVRSKQVVMVDMRYWEYEPDGTLFAPKAGENHAFRELISQAFPGYTDTPPATTPQMVYKETREYRDKYPNIALMPMEEGAGPIPILMGGAASQSSLVGGRPPVPATPQQVASAMYPTRSGTPAAARPRGNTEDRTIDEFVHTYLAHDLMKMSPKDGWVAAPDRTWVLAGGATEPVLIYSLSGADITLTAALPANSYKAMWFNPHTGKTQDAQLASTSAQTLSKPDDKDWLLLLAPQEK
ncbi:MAG TPA: DUF6298 domain-containing protein [Acidobacteriaceae bacterium]|nr:DUF6298 domain-containing protein [Acidobacteriaceae bacterium]